MNQFQQAVAEVLHRMPLDQEQQPPPKSSGELPKEPSPQELAREEHRRDKQQLEKELTEAEEDARKAREQLPQAEADYKALLRADREEKNLLDPTGYARRLRARRDTIARMRNDLEKPERVRARLAKLNQPDSPEVQALVSAWNAASVETRKSFLQKLGYRVVSGDEASDLFDPISERVA